MTTILSNSNSKIIIIIIIIIIILLVLIYLLFKSINNNKQSGSFLTHDTVTRWIGQDIEIVYIDYTTYDKSIYLALSNNRRFIKLMDDYNRTNDEDERNQTFNDIKKIFNICNIIMNQFRLSINNKLLDYKKNIKGYNKYLDKKLTYNNIISKMENRTINNSNYSGFLDFVYSRCLKLYNNFKHNNNTIRKLQQIYEKQNTNILMIDTTYDYITSTRYSIFNYVKELKNSNLNINNIYKSIYDNIMEQYSLKYGENLNQIRIHKDLFMFYLTQGVITDYQKARELDYSVVPYNKGVDYFSITGMPSFKLLKKQIKEIIKIKPCSKNNELTFITSDIHGKFIDYVCFLLKAGRLIYNKINDDDDYYYFRINRNSARIIFLGDIPNTKVLYSEHDEKLYIQQNLLYQLFTLTEKKDSDVYIRGNHCRNIAGKQLDLIRTSNAKHIEAEHPDLLNINEKITPWKEFVTTPILLYMP